MRVCDNLMKRINFVCAYLGIGGAERVMSLLIDEFINKGYTVRLMITHDYRIDYYIPKTVEVVFLDWSRSWNLFKRFRKIRELRKLIKGEIVISFLNGSIRDVAIAVIGLQNTTFIASERNNPKVEPNGMINKAIRILAFTIAEKVVFQNEMAKNYFPKHIKNKGLVIKNPINSYLPKPYDRKRKVIITLSRLSPQKNLKLLVDSFTQFYEKHTDYRLYIYGEGPLKDKLERYIEMLHMSDYIDLKGFVKDPWESIGDCMMYVSSSDYEGVSNSIMEALAMGLPVVATDCPYWGNRELIDDGINGFLVPTGNSRAMVKAMTKIVEDKALADSMSNRAYEIRGKYNIETIANKWLSLME